MFKVPCVSLVAACTPRSHEALFHETLRDAGLNKYLFEMANIRNQCSWMHSKEKEDATLNWMTPSGAATRG